MPTLHENEESKGEAQLSVIAYRARASTSVFLFHDKIEVAGYITDFLYTFGIDLYTLKME